MKPTEDTPTLLGSSQDEATPIAQGHEADNRSETADGCPCLLVEPCHYACSCAHPVMSGGCMRCAKHGSMEQRIAAAKRLAQVTDLITGGLSQDTVTPSRPGEHKKQELERGK